MTRIAAAALAAALPFAPLAAQAAPLGLPTGTPFFTGTGELSNDPVFFGLLFGDGTGLDVFAFIEEDGTFDPDPPFFNSGDFFDNVSGDSGIITAVGFTIDPTGEDTFEFLFVADPTSTVFPGRSVATFTGEFGSDPLLPFGQIGTDDGFIITGVPASVSIAAVIPLPAALPLSLLGLGALGFAARRRA